MIKSISVLKLQIETEQHVVDARQRARQISRSLGFDNQDQVRIATATSELARNAYQYAGGGVMTFSIDLSARPQIFYVEVADRGPGIPHYNTILEGSYVSKTGMGVGLMGAKKLSDHFDLQTDKTGTTVTLGKDLGPKILITPAEITNLSDELFRNRPDSPFAEMQRQNVELLRAMEELNARQTELSDLNQEL
ncbi:MAG: anti-sigma regulatory factor, partial [Proteobacteria bacterium]